MIKGKTKIELTDVNTGEKKVIEKHNAITDGVEQHLKNNGVFNNSPFIGNNMSASPFYQYFFGGILLFDRAINPVDNVYPTLPPDDAIQIAHGSYSMANNTTVTEFGTYNNVESSASANQVVMVYDWTTSQGNGTIGSICLTSRIGGCVGYGDTNANTSLQLGLLTYGNSPYNYSYLSARVGSSNRLWSIKDNTLYWTGIEVDNERCTYTARNSFPIYMQAIPVDTMDLFNIKRSRTITLPASLTSANNEVKYLHQMKNGKFFIIKNNSASYMWSNNDTISYGIYDASTNSFITDTITNATGVSLNFKEIPFVSDKWLTFKIDNTLYVYNFNSHTWTQIDNAIYNYVTAYNVYQISENRIISVSGFTPGFAKIINLESATVKYCQLSFDISSSNDAFLVDDATLQLGTYGYVKNPFYLATINNLEQPVTKTASQTMKVTYTLTKA